MNIYYNNKIYFFKENDYEKNILFLKIKNKYKLDSNKINALIELYISKKRYGV